MSTWLYLKSWYDQQTDNYPSDEEIAEARAAFEREEAEREEVLRRREEALLNIPDEEYPDWDDIPF